VYLFGLIPKRLALKIFLYFPQSQEGHNAVITNVEKFFLFLVTLYASPFEEASFKAYYFPCFLLKRTSLF
jgi:hypothetical protein